MNPTSIRPSADTLLQQLADYVLSDSPVDAEAESVAQLCLMDSLGCALQALSYPACTKLLGPTVPGATLPGGARVPGTSYELEPVQAAFNIGAMICSLDSDCTWPAASLVHPADTHGGIRASADYLSPMAESDGR